MRFEFQGMAAARGALLLMTGVVIMATAESARAQQVDPTPWRVAASTGAYVPLSALIRAADTDDTRLAAGPAFSLEAQYLAFGSGWIYASGLAGFGTARLGSSIQPEVVGPSDQVMLVAGTAGVVLGTSDWLGEHLQPTLRLGGGFKWYTFDLTGAESQLRPTADIGVGFRGVGLGAIDVSAEVRYLPSSFDQGKLPTRGIAAQEQQQNDLVLSIGVGIRP